MPTNRNQLDGSTVVALSLWAVVGSVSMVLVGRSMAGTFDAPVSPAVPALATLVVLVMSLRAWTLFYSDQRRADAGRRLLDGLFAVVPAGLTGFATSINATPIALAAVSSLLICGLVWVAAWEGIRLSRTRQHSETATIRDVADAIDDAEDVTTTIPPAHQPVVVAERDDASTPIQQHMSRRTLPTGGEEIEAVLIARFEAGQRQTAVHLPIHPVLPTLPSVECEPLDESVVTVRPTAIHGYGVRIEVKRTESIAVTDVPIGVLLSTSQSGESAA